MTKQPPEPTSYPLPSLPVALLAGQVALLTGIVVAIGLLAQGIFFPALTAWQSDLFVTVLGIAAACGGFLLALRRIGVEQRQIVASVVQQEREKAENQFDLLFQNADAIAIHDLEGHFLNVNQKFCDRLGYSRSEMLHMTVAQIDTPEYALLIPERIENLLRRGQAIMETAHARRDGKVIPIEISSQIIQYMDQPAVLSIARDISSRKQVEEALLQSTEQYRTTLRTMLDGFWVLDEQGHFLEVNDAYCQFTGYSRDELMIMTVQDLESIESPRETLSHIEQVIAAGVDRFETRHRCKDGHLIDLEVSTSYLSHSRRFFSFLRNITLRKQAEARLHESEERFRATFEQAAVGIAHVAPDGRFLRVNQRLCTIVGYTAPELLERTFQDITHPDDLNADLEYVRQMLANERKTYSMQKRYFNKDRNVVWVNLTVALVREPSGLPKYFISVIEDISLQKEAEKALQISEGRYRAVSEMTSDFAYAMCPQPEGGFKLEWVTDAFTRITGYTSDELDRRGGWTGIIHPEDHNKVIQTLAAVQAGKSSVSEVRLITKDSQTRWVRFHNRPEWDARREQIVRILGAGQDITEYRLIEQEMTRAERLAVMGQVTATLAHEIKNPLQALHSSLSLLSSFPLESDERTECLDICLQEVKRLMDITQNLLSLSRLGRDVYRPVSISQACQQTLDLLNVSIQKSGIRVAVALPDDLPPVFGSPEQIVQVLLNITLNSIESMPKGGNLDVTGHLEEDSLVISLSNDGPPIPPEHLNRLFEPFFTTKPSGTGLGLFISHSIIQHHGGSLSAANLPANQGVCFTINLPVAREDQAL